MTVLTVMRRHFFSDLELTEMRFVPTMFELVEMAGGKPAPFSTITLVEVPRDGIWQLTWHEEEGAEQT